MTWAAVLLLLTPPWCFGLPPHKECFDNMRGSLGKLIEAEKHYGVTGAQLQREQVDGWRRVFEFWWAATVASAEWDTFEARWEAWFMLRDRLWR